MLLRNAALLAGLAALFLAGGLLSNEFLTVENQRDVLETVSINGILAVGMTLVILTAGIDLSVGSILSICTVVCAMLIMPPDFADDGVKLGGSGWLTRLAEWLQLTRAHILLLPAVALAGGYIGWSSGAAIARRSGAHWVPWLGMAALMTACLVGAIIGMRHGFSTLGVLIVVPPVGGLLGLASGVIIAKTRLQPFIVTLAMMIFAVGLAKYIAGEGGRVRTVYTQYVNENTGAVEVPGAPPSFEHLGTLKLVTVAQRQQRDGTTHDIKLIPVPGLFLIGCWALAAFVLLKLPLGRHIYAVGGNEEAARLSGISTDRVKIFVYAASGLLAGLAAVLYCAKLQQGKADAGQMKELDAIAAVVIGGTSLMGGRGSIFGTLVGVMIFGYLSNILNLRSVSSEIQEILKGVIIVGAAAVQTGWAADLVNKLRRRRIQPADIPTQSRQDRSRS
ncbi:MAG: ABC transporter permease [Phycisphaerae bacterium]|nr:ABC transporter permease [Phycisphaerae bacterium]